MTSFIDLSSSDINVSVEELQLLLANTYLLYTRTQYCHWNVEGVHFYSLHKMFEGQYEELSEAVDLIAERVRNLGFKTAGTITEFLKIASIKDEWPKNEKEMIQSLLNGHEAIIQTLRYMLEKIAKSADEGTRDLAIERLRAHEKSAWMLRSSKL